MLAERKQGWAACLPRCKQGHKSLHGHPGNGEYLNPPNAVDSFWGSNLQHGSHLGEYYPTTEVDGRLRRFFLLFALFLAFSRRKRTAEQARKITKASHSTRKTRSKSRSP